MEVIIIKKCLRRLPTLINRINRKEGRIILYTTDGTKRENKAGGACIISNRVREILTHWESLFVGDTLTMHLNISKIYTNANFLILCYNIVSIINLKTKIRILFCCHHQEGVDKIKKGSHSYRKKYKISEK